jgi:hypothetical protein
LSSAAQGSAPYAITWSRQSDTSADDSSYGVSADALGNVFIAGYTFGSLGGPSGASNDAHVIKYDSPGNLIWARQLGAAKYDFGYDVQLPLITRLLTPRNRTAIVDRDGYVVVTKAAAILAAQRQSLCTRLSGCLDHALAIVHLIMSSGYMCNV